MTILHMDQVKAPVSLGILNVDKHKFLMEEDEYKYLWKFYPAVFRDQWVALFHLLTQVGDSGESMNGCLKDVCHCSIAKSCPTLGNPMNCAYQAILSFTISQSLLKLMSFELVFMRRLTKSSPPINIPFLYAISGIFLPSS